MMKHLVFECLSFLSRQGLAAHHASMVQQMKVAKEDVGKPFPQEEEPDVD